MRELSGLGPAGDPGIVVVDGHFRLMAALTIVAVLVVYAVFLWLAGRSRKRNGPGTTDAPKPDLPGITHGRNGRRSAA